MRRAKKARLLALLAVCVAAALAVAIVAGRSTSTATDAQGALQAVSAFDASTPPPDVLPVIVVSGNPYEMGSQYGVQARDTIARNVNFAEYQCLSRLETHDAILARMHLFEGFVQEKTPEILDWWQGIADGSGQTYESIAILNMSMQIRSRQSCSTISLWGRATRDGRLICGKTSDRDLLGGYYTVVLIAFPEGGNSWIDVPGLAGELNGLKGMNSAGLVDMVSGSESARPEDRRAAYPSAMAGVPVLASCDTVDDAIAAWRSLDVGGSQNLHFADAAGDVAVLEGSSAGSEVRRSGDFGERDYLQATNFFLTETMLPANYANQLEMGELDDWYRYGTEEKLIKDGWGKLDLRRLAAILQCHDYYGTRDPVTGAVDPTKPQRWHRNVWSLKPEGDERSMWTPEMRGLSWKCLQTVLFVPGERTMYVRQGSGDTRSSAVPNSTGKYCKFVLGEDIRAIVDAAQNDATLQLWYAARDLDLAQRSSASREAKLEKAKSALWEGINVVAQAELSDGIEEANLLYGKALTCFCKAQTYAQQASRTSILN